MQMVQFVFISTLNINVCPVYHSSRFIGIWAGVLHVSGMASVHRCFALRLPVALLLRQLNGSLFDKLTTFQLLG